MEPGIKTHPQAGTSFYRLEKHIQRLTITYTTKQKP